jgi:uncharacterized membrane protein YuzA (DUF378 family)
MRLEGDFHQRGASAGGVVLGSKINLPFCQRCTRGFEFLGLVWGLVFGFFLWLWLFVEFLGWDLLGFVFGFSSWATYVYFLMYLEAHCAFIYIYIYNFTYKKKKKNCWFTFLVCIQAHARTHVCIML